MLSEPKIPAIAFFLIASVLMALSTFLWFGMRYFVDKSRDPSLLSMESGFSFAAALTALCALASVAKGIQRQMKFGA